MRFANYVYLREDAIYLGKVPDGIRFFFFLYFFATINPVGLHKITETYTIWSSNIVDFSL